MESELFVADAFHSYLMIHSVSSYSEKTTGQDLIQEL